MSESENHDEESLPAENEEMTQGLASERYRKIRPAEEEDTPAGSSPPAPQFQVSPPPDISNPPPPDVAPNPIPETVHEHDRASVLREQKRAQKRQQKKSKLTQALIAAVIFHLVLGGFFAIWTVIPRLRDEPEIVAEVLQTPPPVNPKMEKKNIVKQMKKSSSASLAAPLSKMVRANANTRLSVPNVTSPSKGLLGVGEGDFGDGLFGNGNGDGDGMGSGASFFGASGGGGNSLCFILDYSASMQDNQRKLAQKETIKALRALPVNSKFQVVMFSGPSWFIGTKIDGRDKTQTLTDPEGKKITFKTNGGAADFRPEGGKLFQGKWINVSSKTIAKAVRDIGNTPYTYGTQWTMPMETALSLSPPPEVIYFMSDGNANDNAAALGRKARSQGTVVHTFAMQTTKGSELFESMAESSGGEFRLILANGKSVLWKDYQANPGKYKL